MFDSEHDSLLACASGVEGLDCRGRTSGGDNGGLEKVCVCREASCSESEEDEDDGDDGETGVDLPPMCGSRKGTVSRNHSSSSRDGRLGTDMARLNML
jgi:hypothetical protein